ncbi:hypothetical protein [Streptomyces sp. MZ04]|uniref:hypothetical protein n=1 Tax=Streptomyces sp. MZ04 TaxID=2559236 RepID=UPI00107ECB1B|nr:hypothetical protein [Streptomyces sp. MZ04]TGA94399.1 hypothetical protein E2651_35260 [Streptomyces sp. MZ04]
MRFDDDAELDTSEVQDVRGSRIPGGRATVGGGIAGLIALVLALLFGVGPDQPLAARRGAAPLLTSACPTTELWGLPPDGRNVKPVETR